MSLIVETGLGVSNAVSYISLADADAYIADHDNSAAWSAAADADKEKYLRLATQYIDLQYGNRFKGYKTARDNALCWPRLNVCDADGYYYLSTEIPACIKYATVEAALMVLAGDDLLGVLANPGIIASESKKIGPLEKSVTYVGGKAPVKSYPRIKALLRPVIELSDSIQRG
jgi:hypothetical protein